MKWTTEKIVEWHKNTFVNATLENQLLKLEEELTEVVDAQRAAKLEESYDELADVYIVAIVLKHRFNSTAGSYFVGLCEYCPPKDLYKRVDKKMNENVKRKWKFDPDAGVYRHFEKVFDKPKQNS